MLGRAKAEAQRAASGNPPSRATTKDLAKQLFPSSSPGSAPQRLTQSSITDTLTKGRAASGFHSSSTSTNPARTATTKEPLRNRPLNVLPKTNNGKSLTSFLTKSDSFREESEMINLIDECPVRPLASHTNNVATQLYSSDFSDDEDLALDLEAPTAAPTLPPRPAPSTTQKSDEPPPASNTSILSWSQSSPSHLRHPQEPVLPPRVKKRPSQGDDEEPIPIAAKKSKRELPPIWVKQSATQDQDLVEVLDDGSYTPAPKTNPEALWNTTASTVKAQKKQLKTQPKGPGKADVSVEEMHQAMKSNTTKQAPISLSNEQRHVKSLVVEKGQSVFFTGPAGTGKSVLMRAIIQELKKKYAKDPERVAVTASTGLAACNIGGMTLHSFSGIGLGKEDVNVLVKKIRRNPRAKNRWLRTKVLIIDEVSMVDAELFDKLSQVGRIMRNNGRPWGGIQLVITGDFFQLPPVPDGGKQKESKFAFDAATWNLSIDHTIGLTEVFRQRDPEFAGMLNEMRLGRISDETVKNFQALSRPLRFNDGLEVTELFPTRNEVDNSNQRRLKALKGQAHRYTAVDTGDEKVREKLLANMMAPPVIELKLGAQVMLIKNMDETLVNGSLGTVVDFMTESASEQLNTVGTADYSDVDSDTKKRIRKFANALADSKGDSRLYPVVRFHAVDGTQRNILCVPEDWKVELPTGEIQASRKQVPLILAWALSIHKAQGQTLERVKVDLGNVFEKGQAYVALSRATTQEGLQVLNFQKARVMAHARVVEFYNKLYSAETAVKKKAQGSITSYTVKKTTAVGTTAGPSRQQQQPRRQESITVIDDEEQEAMAAYG